MPRCVLLVVLGIVFQLSNGIEFNVTQDGKLCLYADLKLVFSVDYEDLDDEIQTAAFPLPDDAKSDESTCGETQSVLKLNFGAGNSWSFTFSKTGESYQADTINFTYNLGDPVYFPNTKSEELVTVTTMPTITNVGVDTSYSCKSAEELKGGTVSMTLSDVLIQAFISDGIMSDSITGCAADQSVITETTVPTTAPNTTVPTTAPNTTTPTAPTTAPNTTTPTAPTTAPNTTTPTTAPNATTPTTAPTTAPNATTPMTAPTTAPNATTMTTPKTTPVTTPVPTLPVPTTGNYSIKVDENSTACLLANFGLRIAVKQGEKLLDMNFDPSGASVSGSCGINSSELVLKSKEMTINFTFTNDTKKFRLHALNVSLTSGSPVGSTNLSLWEASVGSSYMCNKEQTFNITDSLTIYTFSLHVQPFGVQKGVFSTAEECFLDSDLSFLVPIAVGVALSFLIILVLISYLIGRRKSRTGYQSV
ncbi:lysosome-associated membrane glycoprotein 2 isoform X3 [Archocentrus centrarchus]|uniref:lysosome-associated membrane glycoprotein 2 isoform X3 n=1 Tax=Archocentrus centrarchus TaxID=63155 RepID=UPI0011EA4524|nr:lysosome-associated membrane glycoprotein 2-like isoform X3 [Archocentrus centrarchus]